MMADIGWIGGGIVGNVLGWLLTYAVHSTILLGGAALVTGRLIRTDAWRETVWRVALVGALVTATLQSGLGLQPLAGEWRIALGERDGVAPSDVATSQRTDASAWDDASPAGQTGPAAWADGVASGEAAGSGDAGGSREAAASGEAAASVERTSVERPTEVARAYEHEGEDGHEAAGAGRQGGQARDGVAASAAALRGPDGPGAASATSAQAVPVDRDGVEASPIQRRAPERELTGATNRASTSAAPAPAGSGDGMPWWPEAVLAIWAGAVLFLLVRLVARQLRLHRLLRDRHPVTEGSVLSVLAALRRNAGVWRPIELTASFACPGPLALGTSEICVPERFLRDLDPEQQRSALAHELAHLARRDPAWSLLTGLFEAVFFFQPLNRLARLRLRETAENLSDDWAVRQTGSALGLARCLAEVASWVGRGTGPVPSGTMAMAEGGSPLLLRVERLLAERIPHAPGGRGLRSTAAAGVLLLVWVAAPLVSAGAIGEPADAGDGNATQGEATQREADGATASGMSGTGTGAGLATDGGSAYAAPSQPAIRTRSGARFQEQVIRHPAPEETLDARWQWTAAEAERRGDSNYWVAHSFERLLPATTIHIDDSGNWSSDEFDDVPLGTLIYGPSYERPTAAGVVAGPTNEPPQKASGMVRQPVLVLFHMVRTRAGVARVGRVSVRTASAGMNLRGAPLYWLGPASDAESFGWLRGRLDEVQDVRLQGTIVEALTMHEDANRVLPFLEEVVGSDRPNAVREEAVEGLSWHPIDRSVALLRVTALEDRSRTIREEAAETLGELRTPAASAALAELLRVARSNGVRQEAVQALGTYPEPEVLETLLRVAMEDRSDDIQHEAIETIAAFPAASAVPALDEIARTHPRTDTRREAVEALGEVDPTAAADVLEQLLQSDVHPELRDEAIDILAEQRSPEALEAIFQVVMTDPEPELQEEAVEKLAGFDPAAALPRVEQVVWEHPRIDVRDEAVEMLGQFPADLALPVLDEIIASHEDGPIVQEAIQTIAEFPPDVSMPRLLQILREHPLEEARREALDQLADMRESQ